MSTSAPQTPPPAPPATRFADLLAIRPFVFYWWARLTAQLSTQMLMVALGWHMYDITASAWDLGLVGLAQFVPALMCTLPAGHLADRVSRKKILMFTAAVESVVAALLLISTHGGWATRELVLGISVLMGVARAFMMPAAQALLPRLVPPALLSRAMATSSSGIQLAIIAGPALGGVLYVAGATAVYGLCLALFALGALLLAAVPLPPRPIARPEPTTWRTVLAGVHFIWQRPVLLGAMSLDLFAVLLGGATALLPIFAKDILHVGPWGLGLLRAAPAMGAFVMSIWLARHPIERHVGRRLIGAVAVFGLCMLAFGTANHWLVALVALAISGAADMVSVVIRLSLMQLETPDEMRGRVSAVSSIFIGASNQLGEFESGATAAWLGPVGSVVLGGLGTLGVCAAWVRLFPALWRRDRVIDTPHPAA